MKNKRLCKIWGGKYGALWETSSVWVGNAQTKTECAYASVLLFFLKMSEFLELFKILQAAGNYGFKTLVDIFEKVDRLLPILKSHPNVIHSPVKIFYFCSFKLNMNHAFNQKNSKIHQLRIKKCPKTEPKSKNSILKIRRHLLESDARM